MASTIAAHVTTNGEMVEVGLVNGKLVISATKIGIR